MTRRYGRPRTKKRSWISPKDWHYEQRDQCLSSMGFNSYRAYLQSDLWKGIKQRVLAERPTCWVCEHKAKVVHHSDYDIDTLEGHRLTGLISLCRPCHKRAEFRSFHRKVGLQEANFRLFKRQKRAKNKAAKKAVKRTRKKKKVQKGPFPLFSLAWPSKPR